MPRLPPERGRCCRRRSAVDKIRAMPARPFRICRHPGCSALVYGKVERCAQHLEAAKQVSDARKRELDERRGTATSRGYDVRWRRFREQWLRQHPICGDRIRGRSAEHSACAATGRVTPGTDVDHIVPHSGDPALFWDEVNLQTLCRECHNRKTAQETNRKRNMLKA